MGMLKSWPHPLGQRRAVQGPREPMRTPESWIVGEEGNRPILTSAEDDALIRNLVLGLKAGAIPALVPELVLALMDGNLNTLDG